MCPPRYMPPGPCTPSHHFPQWPQPNPAQPAVLPPRAQALPFQVTLETTFNRPEHVNEDDNGRARVVVNGGGVTGQGWHAFVASASSSLWQSAEEGDWHVRYTDPEISDISPYFRSLPARDIVATLKLIHIPLWNPSIPCIYMDLTASWRSKRHVMFLSATEPHCYNLNPSQYEFEASVKFHCQATQYNWLHGREFTGSGARVGGAMVFNFYFETIEARPTGAQTTGAQTTGAQTTGARPTGAGQQEGTGAQGA